MSIWKSKPHERNHRVLISWVDLCRGLTVITTAVWYIFITLLHSLIVATLRPGNQFHIFILKFFGGGSFWILCSCAICLKCKIRSSDSFQLIQILNYPKRRVLPSGSSFKINNKKVVGLSRIDGLCMHKPSE